MTNGNPALITRKAKTWLDTVMHRSWRTRLSFVLIAAVVIAGGATYAALTDAVSGEGSSNRVFWLLNIDLVLLLGLVTLTAWRLVELWSSRRKGIPGTQLHVRLVVIFSLLAAVPAIIMTIFSAFFFHYGVQNWFSQRVSTAVQESQAVAEAYLEEHQQVIRADALAMANDLDRQAHLLIDNPPAFDRLMHTQSLLRNLSEAMVFDSAGRVLAQAGLTFTMEFEDLPDIDRARARTGEVVMMTAGSDDRVRALLKLSNFVDSYLFVGRMVDPQVLSHVDTTRQAAEQYEEFQGRYSDLQVMLTMIYVMVAMLLTFAAIWLGLFLAQQIISPVQSLIGMAERVRSGDLSARAEEGKAIDELDYLARAFNRMTAQLQEHRNDLLEVNRQLDQRRHFIESVLSGVSSGVLGVEADGTIRLANGPAADLFDMGQDALVGRNILEFLPDLSAALVQAYNRPARLTQTEMPYLTSAGGRRNLHIRIAIEHIGEQKFGAVITFDDITELQAAQRKAAWADVARRIAHEIKNPLTPIQLSAERLRRKYLKEIKDEPEIFEKCTDTIIRHVEDIGRMVNEFSSFARMPEPDLEQQDLDTLICDEITFHKQAYPEIRMTYECQVEKPAMAFCDSRQIRQALNNLIQNAVDAIHMCDNESCREPEAGDGFLRIGLLGGEDSYYLMVRDNGCGLPAHSPADSLVEPYVTHKEKGTGLGLAIVKKIMEDHAGQLILGYSPLLAKHVEGSESFCLHDDEGGALVTLVIPSATCHIVNENASGAESHSGRNFVESQQEKKRA